MSDTLFILGPDYSTFTRSVRIYCEMMNIAYESGMVVSGQTLTLKSKALTQYNPFRKVPVLLHGDITIFETTAICRYLERVYVKQSLKPSTADEAALVDSWAQAISIYVDKAVIRDYVLEFSFPKGDNGKIREDVIAKNFDAARENLAIVSKQLGNKKFLCGAKFSIADAILLPILHYADKTPNKEKLFSTFDNLLGYLIHLRLLSPIAKILS